MMNSIIKKIFYFQCLTICCLLVGCENIDDEITELDLPRYLKILNVKANSLGGTQVRLDWDQSKNADSYIVEFFADDADMNFEGQASLTLEDIQNIDLPYTLQSGLEGSTTYAIRVKAVGEKADDSLWSDGVTIRTAGEQLLYAVDRDDITYNSAIIKWVPGETATHLLLTGGGEENKRIELSQTHIAAGECEITDLFAETTYIVQLMNGNKQRGETSFTTGINLGDAIEVKTDDDFQSMINDAEPGSKFYLSETMYIYSNEITVNKSITIVSGGNATISAQFKLTDGASIALQNLILDGLDTFDAVLVVTTNDQHGTLSIDNCIIKNYNKRLIDANSGTAIVSAISINESVISNIPGSTGSDFIDFRNSKFDMMSITNSTFYDICNTVNRDFIRADHSGTDRHKTIQISNCTFSDILSEGKRFLYVRGLNDITFTNNIIANSSKGYFNDQTATQTTTFDKNVYYLSDLYMASTVDKPTNDTSGTVIDPGFADPANGDFTVTNDNLKYEGIGDPRWLP